MLLPGIEVFSLLSPQKPHCAAAPYTCDLIACHNGVIDATPHSQIILGGDMTCLRSRSAQHSRRLVPMISVVILMSLIAPFRSAKAQGGPERDAAALAAMESSIVAMGGANEWAAIQDWTITGQVSTSGSGQQANFSWIGSGVEFHIETDSNSSSSIFLSGHGSPARIINGTVFNLNYFMDRANPPLYLPGVCLTQELSNQKLTIQYLGTTTVNGIPAVQVQVTDNSDAQGSLVTPHSWYFNAATYLPLQVTLRLPPNENPSNYTNGSFTFGQFATANGLLVPSQVTLANGNLSTKAFSIASAAFNTGVPQSEFNPPQGGGQ